MQSIRNQSGSQWALDAFDVLVMCLFIRWLHPTKRRASCTLQWFFHSHAFISIDRIDGIYIASTQQHWLERHGSARRFIDGFRSNQMKFIIFYKLLFRLNTKWVDGVYSIERILCFVLDAHCTGFVFVFVLLLFCYSKLVDHKQQTTL